MSYYKHISVQSWMISQIIFVVQGQRKWSTIETTWKNKTENNKTVVHSWWEFVDGKYCSPIVHKTIMVNKTQTA